MTTRGAAVATITGGRTLSVALSVLLWKKRSRSGKIGRDKDRGPDKT